MGGCGRRIRTGASSAKHAMRDTAGSRDQWHIDTDRRVQRAAVRALRAYSDSTASISPRIAKNRSPSAV
jgi:hypothetical protein